MPLHHGRTTRGIRASIGKNIKLERSRGYGRKQAIAIALNTARTDARKHHIKPASVGVKRRYRRR
jgi:hypothetical protein